ncbi:MAG: hypothetical protein WCK76_07500 [Elusimicrobiota bacterium]
MKKIMRIKSFWVMCLVLGIANIAFSEDAEVKLNSNDGSTKMIVQDKDAKTVSSFDSAGNLVVNGTATVAGSKFSVGGSTFVVRDGSVGIGTTGPGSRFEVVGGSSTFRGSNSNLAIAGFTDAVGNYRVMISTGGNVGIGTTVPVSKLTVSSNISAPQAPNTAGVMVHAVAADGVTSRLLLDTYQGGSGSGTTSVLNLRLARGTAAAPSAVQTNDMLGLFAGYGYAATGYSGAKVSIQFKIAENWTDSAQGTYMSFYTTTAGTTSAGERVRIDPSGNVGIGTDIPGAKLEVAGAILSSSASFTATGSGAENVGLKVSSSAYLATLGGNVGIGTTGPGYKLDIQNGDINASGNLREAGAALSEKYAYIGGANASGTWPVNVSGSAGNVAWTGVTSKPLWMQSTLLTATMASANKSMASGFYEAFDGTNYPTTGTWYSLINARHDSPANDHGFQIAASYFDENFWTRTYSGGTGNNDGTYTAWKKLVREETGPWALSITGNAASVSNGVYTNAANSFSLINPLTTIAESWVGPSSTAGIYFKGGNVGIGTTAPGTALDVNGAANAASGYRVAGAAASGNYLRGNGTNFVASAIQAGDVAGAIGGTPALTLGTSNGAGTATTFVRTDATLLAFDSTLPAALGTAAAGSAAAAARRDHVHAAADLGGASTAGLLPVSKGGTGQSTTATAGRYLKGDGTNWGTSAASASGTGACGTNAWASTLNSDAAPTCTQPGFSNLSGAVTLVQLPNGTANQILGTNSGGTGEEQKTLSVGTSGTDFAIAHAANSVTFNLPDASVSARGAVTTGAQTFAGTKTFSSAITGPTATNTINSVIINAGAVSGVTTLGMNNQLTNSYTGAAALNLTGNGAGVTFTGIGPNQIITASGVNLALMPGGGTGNVGIGLTNPGAKLEVAGGSMTVRALDSMAGIAAFQAQSGSYRLLVATDSVKFQPYFPVYFSDNSGWGGGIRYDQAGSEALIMATRNPATKLYLATGYNFALNPGQSITPPASAALVISGANVGIGTDNPADKLQVSGGITASSATLNTTADAGLRVSSSAYLATSGGNVGIGTTAPSTTLDVNGSLGINQSFYQVSPSSGTWYTLFTDATATKAYLLTVEMGSGATYGIKMFFATKLGTTGAASTLGTPAGTIYTNILAQWSGDSLQISENYGTPTYLKASYIRLMH